MLNNRQLLLQMTRQLKDLGIEDAAEEARYALSSVQNCDISTLLLSGEAEADEIAVAKANEIINRRKQHEPLAYILGERWFMGLKFKVTPAVLIPRQETEILTEAVLSEIKGRTGARVLDMCTGSGCIAIAIDKLSDAEVTGADISLEALAVAGENAKENESDIHLIESDLFENISGAFDVIVSNPPYVTDGEYRTLMPEVKLFEPQKALTAGEDGLDIYRKLIPEAKEHLMENGILMCEIGADQKGPVTDLFMNAGYREINCMKDLAGRDRVMTGRK